MNEIDTIEDFTDWLLAQDRSPVTARNYRSDLKTFNRWFEQTNGTALTPELLTPTDVREYRQYLLSVERRKASTINRRLAALSAYSTWAQDQGLLEYNPTESVRSVGVQARAPRWLNRQAQAALLRELELLRNASRTPTTTFRSQRNQAIVLFLLNTGLRIGELCALSIDDMSINARKGQVLVRQGKGSKQRTVPLNLKIRQVLKIWLTSREEWLERLEMESDNLFIGHRDCSLQPRSIQKMISKVGDRIGLELTPHVLRHTFGKNLVNAGVSLEKVAALLGHSNLNTTRLYVTPGQQDLEKAVETLV